jgi:hypothetical protein
LLSGNVSDNVFFGGLPTTIKENWNDMVVVDCSGTIKDMDAYGRGIVSILLYPSKNFSNGSKNVAVLSSLSTLLNNSIAGSTDEHYSINRMGMTSDYDTIRKIYYDIVFLNIRIH